MSDFKKVHTGKNGDTWEHTSTGLARYFDRREMEYASSDNDSEDGMKGPGYNGFTGKMTYRSWGESEVEADFLKEQAIVRTEWNPAPKWKPYEMVYHAGYREYQVNWKS
jgi:hypothetical protein